MMRGPDKDAVVVRGKEGLTVEVTPRKLPPEHSPLRWPLIRGIYNFFGSNIVGVKALMRSADLSPEEGETEAPSKFDQWLEKKLGNEGFQKALVGFAGPRVVEQTIGQPVPEGFQSAEYQLDHGFLDAVVPRKELRATLSRLLRLHDPKGGRDR